MSKFTEWQKEFFTKWQQEFIDFSKSPVFKFYFRYEPFVDSTLSLSQKLALKSLRCSNGTTYETMYKTYKDIKSFGNNSIILRKTK